MSTVILPPAEPSIAPDGFPRERWRILPPGKTPKGRRISQRLNSLGSLYYFSKVVLGNERLVRHLHEPWCERLSDPGLHLVLEAPRDHFKSTIGSVSLPIWWALPFGAAEEDWMFQLGYSEEFVRNQKVLHSVNRRTRIASEVEENAVKIGMRIDAQYTSNPRFRDVFEDLIPGTGANWNQLSMTQKRNPLIEGATFEITGMGGAIQSRHADRSISDDLYGEKALYSPSVAEQTFEWFRKLPGAFDTDILAPGLRNLELVIGNRWGMRDLNAWIRENDPSFEFETHSAEGGCCPGHPPGTPIFPEEFTLERLAGLRVRFGLRGYSAHYLNKPMAEEEASFRAAWLPRFRTVVKEAGFDTQGKTRQQTVIQHNAAKDGSVEADIPVADLRRILVLDPNHGGENGRARHAAVVIGVRKGANGMKRLYLLECWAKSVSHDSMMGEVGKLARRWRVQEFYVETIAGQDGWLAYFTRVLYEADPGITVRALPKERGAGAKERRILSMSPLYERGQVLVRVAGAGVEDFMGEYETHPQSRTVDLLDCVGYLFNIVETGEVDAKRWAHLAERANQARARSVGRAGY